jgi:NADH-quinone oxidoreductase subunit J
MQFLFLVIAAVGLVTALGTILARNLVHAAMFLVGFFFTVACLFVLLEAEFLAALQVLVYIGAVAILMMFGIMLTRNVQGNDPTSAPSAMQRPGLVAGLGIFVILALGIYFQQGLGDQLPWTSIPLPRIGTVPGRPTSARTEAVNNMGRMVGNELMTRYVIAFEVAGLLLTAALVGAIAVAHREEEEPAVAAPRAGQTAAREPADANGPPGAQPIAKPAEAAPLAAR